MDTDSPGAPKSTFTETLFVVFLRMVAVSCFWFGIEYWAMLVGFSSGGGARFDLVGPAWRGAGAALAVVFPVAALGLWLPASWGAVIWSGAALGQLMMYIVWPDIFGANWLVPLMHVLVAAVYVFFRFALALERREKMTRVSSGLP